MSRGILSWAERIALAWEGTTLAMAEAWASAAPVRAACRRQWERTRAWPIAWSFLYVALFCLLSYWAFDRPLARLLKAHVGGDVEGFFKVVTNLGLGGVYLVPAGVLFLGLMLAAWRAPSLTARDSLRRLAVTPAFLFLSVALSGLAGNAVKFCLGRYRPRYLFDQDLYGFALFSHKWAMNSFPSGHSQAAFAAMTALAIIVPRYDLMWLAIATLVALSRVVTTVHFLSDAVAGSWLGVAVTIALARAFRAKSWEPRLGKRW
ncbi:MAG TPA: phosphatase PAP2 family protein [Magnetospirillum sp.]|jgi:membrane-associated phospholipid phosphatase|nr:phosphatase PAP2 family protein [Magnetospirillum sp.]